MDFGYQELSDSTIRGVVFADTNRDGIRAAAERGLADLTVYLDLDNNARLDAGEPQIHTLADQFFTPGLDEAGTYAFTHLAKGTYTVRMILPDTLSATPAAQLVHVVTLAAAEDRFGVNCAAVFRPNEIRGVKFDDANGNHQRDVGEPGVGGATIFLDLDRDNVFDPAEPNTSSLVDGSYAFTGLSPGAYVVREVVPAEYEGTYPTTVGGTLWPDGVSSPPVGNVNPLGITASLAVDESHRETVSLTLPNTGSLTNLVDVFLLFDDTGSFVNNSPLVRGAFPEIIASLQAALPGIDLGFGVGRLEEYGGFASEYATGRPFVLNQPIVAASTAGYLAAIQAALDRTTPGYGGDEPETDFEALYQVVTGLGFDGNNNGSVLDSGPAGLAATQLSPGNSGDVPSFASFRADPAGGVMPAAGTVGGVGFRPGALPIILTATDTGFAYQPQGETTVTGVGGVTLPIHSLTGTSRPSTPFAAGAGIQQTVTALNALGALVIGLGTNPQPNVDPRQGLEALSKLTGAVNQSTTTIPNGTADPIAPGDPLYFQIASGFSASVANGVVSAIQNAVTNVAVNVTVQASDPRVKLINHTGVLSGLTAGQTATFDIEFVGDGIPHRFDLQFVRAGTQVVLGSIPVVLGTPIPGDGYEFEDLAEGEIQVDDDFGSRLVGSQNEAPVLAAIGAQSVRALETLAFTASATDQPADSLTFSLDAGSAALGMTINGATGEFRWSPTTAQSPGTYAVTLTVTDSGSPALNDWETFTVAVLGPRWRNPIQPCDVGGNGAVSPQDVLTLINEINSHGTFELAVGPPPAVAPPPYLDPSGDGWLTPVDVLVVINYINSSPPGPILSAAAGEGEGPLVADSSWAEGLATLIAAAESPDSPTHSRLRDLDRLAAGSPPFIRNIAVGSLARLQPGAESGLLRASATPPPVADRLTRATPRTSCEAAFAGDWMTTQELDEAISALATELAAAEVPVGRPPA